MHQATHQPILSYRPLSTHCRRPAEAYHGAMLSVCDLKCEEGAERWDERRKMIVKQTGGEIQWMT
jgi:hypothetical protein